jgi:hypothetical protein
MLNQHGQKIFLLTTTTGCPQGLSPGVDFFVLSNRASRGRDMNTVEAWAYWCATLVETHISHQHDRMPLMNVSACRLLCDQ